MARSPELFAEEAKQRPKGKSLKPLTRLLPFLAKYQAQLGLAAIALISAAAPACVRGADRLARR